MITWGEFRKAAEEAGIKDGDEIMYMDFSCEFDAKNIFFDPPDDRQPTAKGWRIWS